METAGVVDPEVAAVLAAFPFGPVRIEDLPMLRQASEAMLDLVELSAAVDYADHAVSGDGEAIVRVHTPKRAATGLRPCLYWIHGGGYVIGSYRMNDDLLQRWCELFDCVAVTVEYGLAPEHPYPRPLDDCYAGLEWTHEHAAELGIDLGNLGIAGASAGGGLAAAVALLARDRGEIELSFQALLAPMLDDRMVTASSHWDAPVWPRSSNAAGWQAYLGGLSGDEVPVYAAPARATDLSGLPPTFLRVGAVEGFLDEDVEYARRLAHAGVPVQLHVYPGAPHGFDFLAAQTAVGRLAARDLENWLRIALRAVAPA